MNIKLVFGTLFGTGFLPNAPGTWGSLVTLPAVYIVAYFFPLFGIPIFFVTSCVVSMLCAEEAQKVYGHDPSQFVLDECAGQSLVFIATGFTFVFVEDLLTLLIGFLFFRFFDILKPLGIDKLQKLPGEIGILADDLLAGVYALICLHLSEYIHLALF
ncbi:phosphatidylglycerophosphatase A family protein [Rhodohalobacter sp. 614A]|uniref:phosphatidylglycerophosphatase A family protein n=1 Tax=Rhodohalobacter sp. 614A TaxID=2908649 RepID=UPI001F36A219|nr:phosphatidylglycerophosphatase A [Rhodohalobacter sp. 614A]